MKPRLLLTGASGFLGWNTARRAADVWDVYGVVNSHVHTIDGVRIVRADLTDPARRRGLFQEVKPDAVVHLAALSQPNECEKKPELSRVVNAELPVELARLCARTRIPYVFTSTDLVFDGLHAPYREHDPVGPVNLYGEHKVLAEHGVLAEYPPAAVCRMPLMFGDGGPGSATFLQPMLDSLHHRSPMRLFTDEYRTPVGGGSAATGILLALERNVNGLLHLGGPQRIARYDFGLLVATAAGADPAVFHAVKQSDVPMTAARPPDVSLDSSAAFALGYRPLPPADELDRLING